MHVGGRAAALGAAALVAACVLTSCSAGSPTAAPKKAVRTVPTTSTTTTVPASSTTVTAPTTTHPQIAVPNVIGLKIAAARAALRAAGFTSVSLNAPCNKGTPASQSIVSSLAIPGKPPDMRVGAVPLGPGASVPTGTPIGVTWSGCFGDATTVPTVTGLTLEAAKQALHGVGLTWACYSVDVVTTTSGASAPAGPPTSTTIKTAQTVLVQTPAAGTVLHPGATVSLTMRHCPQ